MSVSKRNYDKPLRVGGARCQSNLRADSARLATRGRTGRCATRSAWIFSNINSLPGRAHVVNVLHRRADPNLRSPLVSTANGRFAPKAAVPVWPRRTTSATKSRLRWTEASRYRPSRTPRTDALPAIGGSQS